MANLAIKAHPTRTKEVIEILEMLGGKNRYHFKGDEDEWFVLNGNIQRTDRLFAEKGFTLEEFLEKYPYKVGDKVMTDDGDKANIVGMVWDNDIDDVFYEIQIGIEAVKYPKELLQPYEEETMDRKYNVEEYLKVWKETEKGLEVVVNDKFELKEDNGKFYIIKKQYQYPKTYDECCEVLKIPNDKRYIGIYVPLDYNKLLSAFTELLICRDAYWKIAGKEMGLGKPWEPRWSDGYQKKWIINFYKDEINLTDAINVHFVLAFPTEEMRDTFYENFKELIKQCKELL